MTRISIVLLLALAVALSGCVTSNQAEVTAADGCNGYAGQLARLRAFDPYLLPNLRSTDDGDDTMIVFVNCTESAVAYYWVDRDGIEQYYGSIEPKSDAVQHSFEGHMWVVRDGDGVGLSVFRAAESMSLAYVTSG